MQPYSTEGPRMDIGNTLFFYFGKEIQVSSSVLFSLALWACSALIGIKTILSLIA